MVFKKGEFQWRFYSKNFNDADEVKNPPKAKVEVVKLGNINASKLVLEPG